MFRIFFKKEYRLEELIFEYIDMFKSTKNNFINALQSCLQSGYLCEDFGFYLEKTHKFESRADDIREEINNLMYGQALIPDARGDVMELLEGIDSILRVFERILYTLRIQKIVPPSSLLGDLSEFFLISLDCCDLLIEQTLSFFNQKKGIRSFLKKIDEMESKCDHYERKILSTIFDSSEISSFEKLQLKELILQIGRISDRADEISKRINVFSLKRRV